MTSDLAARIKEALASNTMGATKEAAPPAHLPKRWRRPGRRGGASDPCPETPGASCNSASKRPAAEPSKPRALGPSVALNPKLWASVIPRNPGEQKPNHYLEMARVAWQNRDQLPFAWRILNQGVCDGCALGTTGLRDWTLDGVHLCMVRLELMRLNTAPALDPERLRDVAPLRGLSLARAARARPPARADDPAQGRARASASSRWDEAYDGRGRERSARRRPERFAVYLTSRGILNEHYYAAQKAARAMGTNHVDNSARLCHAASTVAMKKTLGHGATTCSYTRLDRHRPDRLLRLEHAQQPAGHDEVPLPRAPAGREGRGGQPLLRAGPARATGCRRCRSRRCSARASPTTGSPWTPAATWRS